MVTVALLAMSGVIGMAVDFGWSYFMRRSAQSAADAAALAAINAAMDSVHVGNTTLTSAVSAFSGNARPTDCASISNSSPLKKACDYAGQNGFSSGGDNGRQTVTVSSDTTSPPPTASGVNVACWVTVRITNTIPQLYSAVLGNSTATIAARATAAIALVSVQGAALGLNRENDGSPTDASFPAGADIYLASGAHIQTDYRNGKGIVLSSNFSGSGTSVSSAVSQSAFTMSRGGLTSTGSAWPNADPNRADNQIFSDPMRDLGQPPVGRTALNAYPVPNGTDWSRCPGYPSCGQGIYFAADPNTLQATGGPLFINSSIGFSNNTFGDFVFYGGLNVNAAASFGPGRYILAGVLHPSNPSTTTGGYTLNINTSAPIAGSTGSDAGQLFILTNPSYPGLSAITQSALQAYDPNGLLQTLSFGESNLGNGTTSAVLYGLNANNIPASANTTNSQGAALSDFGPVLIWQDQRFSKVSYTSNGNIDTSCGSSSCPSSPSVDPKLVVGMSSNSFASNLHGIIYQPRGAWMQALPNTLLQGPLQLISGALDLGSGAFFYLKDPGTDSTSNWALTVPALKMRVVALVD